MPVQTGDGTMSSNQTGDKQFDALHRRNRTRPTSTGKRVTPQTRDLLWFQKILEHGPLSTSFLHGFSRHMRVSEKRAKERLTDLFNEKNTPHGGFYLCRPSQQFRTIDSRYNELVYDLTPASIATLKENGLWNEEKAKRFGPWLHSYMASCITASIELATLDRDELTYIPQSRILERAGTTLRFPTKITDPATKQTLTKTLIPDALFGLEYHHQGQKFYRFFLLEADRGTEPTTSKNFNRKSHQRNLAQYTDYVGNGRYKQHLKLTAPLLVLNVSADQTKLKKVISVTEQTSSPSGNSYMLFQLFGEFGQTFRPPKPHREFLDGVWVRAGRDGMRIDQP
jgi:protein involved in plasmid replication-relaxation